MFLSKKDQEELEGAIKRHPAKGQKNLRVFTETGSIYEFDLKNKKVLRFNDTGNFANMRKDAEWIDIVTMTQPVIGESMTFCLTGVAEEPDLVTFRRTSYVTKIEEV